MEVYRQTTRGTLKNTNQLYISSEKRHLKWVSSDCRQSPHVKVWTFLVFSTIQMHLYDIHTTKALRFQCFRGIIYMKRGAL